MASLSRTILVTPALPTAALLLVAAPSAARTWLVKPDGSGDAPTIAAAAESTVAGDSILVAPGEFSGPVSLHPDTHLVSMSGPDVTRVDTPGGAWLVRGYNVVIEGLTLEGPGTGYGYSAVGADIMGDCRVASCRFRASDGPAIDAGAGALEVVDCEFGPGTWVRSRAHLVSIRDCRFTDAGSADTAGAVQLARFVPTDVEVVGCVFEGGASAPGTPVVGWGEWTWTSMSIVVRDNLFVACAGPAAGRVSGVSRPHRVHLLFENNTIARASHHALGSPDHELPDGAIIRRNVITGSPVGLTVPDDVAVQVTCNLAWGNGVNWVGVRVPADGVNLSQPPLYCDPAGGVFTVAANSPCLPAGNPCGARLGAFGAGCGTVGVDGVSWGRLKTAYRR